MKKRLFSILMAFALCLSLLPTAALATDAGSGTTTPSGTPLTQEMIESNRSKGPISPDIRLSDGEYYLTEDIYLVGDDTGAWPLFITSNADVTLDLNGHVLDLRGAHIICWNGTLTLKDSNTDEQTHKFREESNGLWVLDEQKGTEIVTGGVITGGAGAALDIAGSRSTANGGGVAIYSGAFTMSGGSIVGCTADQGGGVYVHDGDGTGSTTESFTMSGGSIVGCTADQGGGVWNGGTFTMSGGSIEKCTALQAGGGVYGAGGARTFTMSGGSIENCNATEGGGVWSSSPFTMSGGSIKNCNATEGGGVWSSSPFTMSGGSIEKCTALQAGGGVYVSYNFSAGKQNSRFTMSGGSIADCTANGVSNAVHADGTFTDNNSQKIDKSLLTGINAGHEGTEADPIRIASVEGLNDFRKRVSGEQPYERNPQPALCAILTCDIVLNDGAFDEDGNYTGGSASSPTPWTPIGNSSNKYSGTFDGGGHTIKGLYVNGGSAYAGLFGYTQNATIKIVTVDGYVSVSGDANNGGAAVGGIVGTASSTKIEGCTNLCTVKNACSAGSSYAGGIAGTLLGNPASNASVTNCRNGGKVILTTSKDTASVGGIAGISTVPVSSCYNTGAIEASSDKQDLSRFYAGGVVGQNTGSGKVENCYNTGAVTVSGSFTIANGGIVSFGGVAGYTEGPVSNCYNTGKVTSPKGNVGGVAGVNYASTVTNCYFLTGTAAAGVGHTVTIDDNQAKSDTCDKTKADFAGGDVLAWLKQNDTSGAWGSNGYLAAAGMTLPLLKGQTGDKHTHDGSWSHDESKHWKACSCGAIYAESAHSGAATCTAKARCADCGVEYGGLNAAIHSALTHMDAKAATTTAEGNIEYWHCTGCGKYFADAAAAQDIPEADTVIAKLPSGGSSTPSVADTAAKDIRNAEPGETVRIAMRGETKLPARVLDAAYGKDVTLEIDMGNGAVWTINGLDIPKGGASLNLGIKTGVTSIPAKVIDAVSGEVSAVQLRLSHDGAFAVRVTLSLMLGKEFDGRFANLYYYNEATGALEFQCSDKIRGGAASWPFAHASEYAIVIDEADHEPMRFADVADGAYYRDAVLWAAKNGITSGTDAVHFSPNLPCTRAQMVTFLWRAAGSPVVNYAMNLTDVSEDAYYAEAVRWALSEGITTGITATTFGPNETCTRAQAVAFLFRYAAPAAVTLQELVSGFGDAASVPGYAMPAMNWALAEGIVQGDGSNLLPNDSCTRAQIVTLLYRALEK